MWLKGSRKPQQCQHSIKMPQYLLHPFSYTTQQTEQTSLLELYKEVPQL